MREALYYILVYWFFRSGYMAMMHQNKITQEQIRNKLTPLYPNKVLQRTSR